MSYAGGYPVKKNTEFLLVFPIYDNDGDLISGALDLDSEISKNGEAFIDCTNEAVEIGTSGVYKLTLTAAEMNCDVAVVITKTTSEDAKTTQTTIYTSSLQLSNLCTLGAGAITWVYTLTDEATGEPIADADVWVTSDLAGTNVIASGKTNQHGQVVFYLDAGTVYVWRQKSGWDFTNPDIEEVTG